MLTAVAFLAQALVLAWVAPLPQHTATLLSGAALIAFAIDRLWWMRRLWTPHLDMVLIMAGWGGLGMLLGPLSVGAPVCHAAPGAMWTGMLLFSTWPSYRYARCLRAAQNEGHLLGAIVFDLAGMAAGMWLAEIPFAFAGMSSAVTWLRHAAMLIGMLLGMGLGMALAKSTILRSRVPANG